MKKQKLMVLKSSNIFDYILFFPLYTIVVLLESKAANIVNLVDDEDTDDDVECVCRYVS